VVLALEADRLVGVALFVAHGGPVVRFGPPAYPALLVGQAQRGAQVVGVEAGQAQVLDRRAVGLG